MSAEMGATPSSVTANTAASFGEGVSSAPSVSSESSATQALAPSVTAEIGITIAYTPSIGEQTGDAIADMSMSEALSMPVFAPAVSEVAEMAQEFASRETVQLQAVRAELFRVSVEQPNPEQPVEDSYISAEQPSEDIQAPPVLDLSPDDEGDSEGTEDGFGIRRRSLATERLMELDDAADEENSEVGSEEGIEQEANEHSKFVKEDSETTDESVQDADVVDEASREESSEENEEDEVVDPVEPPREPDEQVLPPPQDYSLDISATNARIQEMVGKAQDVEEQTGRRATGAEAVANINVADAPSALVSGALKVLPLPGQLIPEIDMSLAETVDTIGRMTEVTPGSITSTVYMNKPVKTGNGEPVNQLDVDKVLGSGASLRRAA